MTLDYYRIFYYVARYKKLFPTRQKCSEVTSPTSPAV